MSQTRMGFSGFLSRLMPRLWSSPSVDGQTEPASAGIDPLGDSEVSGRAISGGAPERAQGPVNGPMKHSEVLRQARALMWDPDIPFSIGGYHSIGVALRLGMEGAGTQRGQLIDWMNQMLGGASPSGFVRLRYPHATEQEIQRAQLEWIARLIAYLESLGK